jgi:dihydroorotate dehydrogenase
MYDWIRPVLFKLDAETAHGLTLYGLDVAHRSDLGRFVPVGLAAGLDKNAAHLDALGALGFGFIEVGTVTPRPQIGNDRPRLFRLRQHEAIINRMGFNNEGVDALVRNVLKSSYRGVLGINIGKNKDTPNDKAADDYLFCLERVYAHASYITVNISSPNTQGLRDLQEEATLRRFIETLREAQERLGSQQGARKPMLLKIAPDLSEAELDSIASVLLAANVDGVICTNTTIDHSAVASDPHGNEAGGLSGKPLFVRSNQVVRGMRQRLGDRIGIVGVGGILDGSDAVEKMDAGAGLVQLYSGLIYRGPALVAECVDEIRRQKETRDAG